MKLHELTPKGYAVTELPEGADHDCFEITKWGALYYYTGVSPNHCGEEFRLPPGNWTVLGFAQDLTEDQWAAVVEKDHRGYKYYWQDNGFVPRGFNSRFDTATESGHSAVKKAGLFVENPYDKDPNILNMYPEWMEAQLLTNPLILIIE